MRFRNFFAHFDVSPEKRRCIFIFLQKFVQILIKSIRYTPSDFSQHFDIKIL